MKLPSRTKLIIWLVAAYAVPGLILYFSTLLNITDLDPTIGDSDYSALYRAEGRFAPGPAGGFDEIALRTAGTEDGRVLRIAGAGGAVESAIAADGSIGPDLYSLFWVHLANPITMVGSQETVWEARVRDGLGLLGEPGKTYTARSLEKFIFWDYVLSSQASYRAGIYDGDTRVASAVYDMTCGMLFELVPNVGGWGRARLVGTGTDFPISRNRYMLAYAAVAFSIVILAWFAFQYARTGRDRKYKALDNLWYALAISLTLLIDYIYDSWFFANGDPTTAALHAAAIVILAFRFRLWVIPMILELAWIFAYTWPTTGLLAPGVTFFPSMLVATAMMLMFRRTPKIKQSPVESSE